MTAPTTITLRHPTAADGLGLHDLIQACPPLDCNTPYAYHLIVNHFSATSIIAENDNGDLVGTVTGYRLPDAPDTLFVWQVAVSEQARGQGLASQMLHDLVQRQSNLRFIHTTIGPGNAPSRRTFAKLAEALSVDHAYHPFLTAEACGDNHEAEDLLIIGPLA